ncbi:protein SRC2 homolog [Rhodamnia argentea]|uniref:Protein SRC2 homolog n=1 Tax=Rhodamnia argentea TaxID=178133 RepID=A0A8B8NLZ7_9MYRT|nr:protein SRC2 homolog [Rhodamnia argentea]
MQQYHLSTETLDPRMSSIQGQLLEVTVVGCNKLKDTEWISRQDPYVCVEYGSSKFRTRTCTDGGKNPTFQEKFVFTLIEGLRELNVAVWNSNTVTFDDFIGSGKIQLQKVLSQGFDDTAWPLQTKTGRYAGEARLILHYANAIKQGMSSAPSAPPYVSSAPQVPLYAPPLPSAPPYGAPAAAYPATAPAYPSYPPILMAYPSHPPNPAAYPPPPHFSPPPSAYPHPAYPPPSAYPPPPYPPPPGPPGPYPGHYPPPPY